MWWHDGMGWGGWAAMSVATATFCVLVIFGLIATFGRTCERTDNPRTPDPDLEDVLRERFARDEIDFDEYHARQEIIRTYT